MVSMTVTTTDPASLSPAQWSGKLAALRSRGAPDDDPRIAECVSALSFWRVRRVLDAERALLDPLHVPALADLLKHAHPAVTR